MAERIDLLNPNPFISSPGDLLAFHCAEQIALVPQFKKIFGEFIDGYLRMDYAIRNLPSLRIYQMEPANMEADNWFITGDLEADIVLPASLRRDQLQTVSDVLTGALLQQFRRTPFFQTMRGLVPGLNWLGQSIRTSKNRAFQIDETTLVPMAVLSINFRVDLREWDQYLEDQDRTVSDPFQRTLRNLEMISTIIAARDDGGDAGVGVPITQNV